MNFNNNATLVLTAAGLLAASSAVASGTTITVSGPSDTDDATVNAFNNGTNYGSTGNIELQNYQTSTRGWGVLRFDLPTLAPNEYISDASITVQYFADFSATPGSISVDLNRILYAWQEDEVTWDERFSGQRWEVGAGNIGWQDGSDPPANYDATSLGNVDLTVGSYGLKVFQSATLTDVLNDMAHGTLDNNGFLLNPTAGGTVNNRFYLVSADRGSSTPGEDFEPQLSLTISTVPEPASLGLMAAAGLVVLGRRWRR